ncbi:SDR family oxidoreductase [Bacteroides thetaiotaomicron]|uniref:SDR family oxidoreductase n=1 Tax=Bacteroides thetaiotaomicron TaxID=818 RepID=UPI002330858A|nr:sugar nucleotide-binding protein [Bacteroides thetaiotaomicron]MDC2010545.1 sugar nucleotide-binding protein [Bacteroides thetaiotaomicron]MDC2020584.1 sugar nucleotide-binding protein [Bacteroides thetaiotaomicron]MDC2027872.1 sugar nucleotide-binding protein [Bacteroides thetaiotaomicron]MDC2029544.1 sugar nucleotide-binding protein [Bacteroides thetaiotaomicron]MDC2060941.1 sugar nucleotide-binding protein [Bacteroides thetaiotaomicron]
MKVLVLGCNGMAGHLISLYFKERGHEVVGFARQKSTLLDNTKIGDASDMNLIKKVVYEGNYDAVINCIGLLNQFAENNKAMAVLLNSYLPHYLVEITKDTATRIVHMSTDCVFAGNGGPYYEDTLPNGVTFYDRSKAMGEINNDKDLTFRNSIIGPDIKASGIGLFNWFMKQEGSICGYTGAIWTGVTTYTLAKAMEQALKENLAGLYNLVNNVSINKFDLCSLFNKYFRNEKVKISPNDKLQLDKSLRRKRTDFSFEVPSYEQQVAEMVEWVNRHKELYPHYFNM